MEVYTLRVRGAAAWFICAALLSACARPASQQVNVAMGEYRFDPSDIAVGAGGIGFVLVNTGTEAHDMSIAEGSGILVVKSDLVASGGSGALSVKLKPGRYVIYCGVALHRDRGMEGTLTVR